MKKIILIIIIVLIAGGIVWKVSQAPSPSDTTGETENVPTSETVKVSEKLSEYKNDELGFSVKYPTNWAKIDSASNVTFDILAMEKDAASAPKNTIGKLEAAIDVISGKCAFPPVTTVKERDSVKVGDNTFSMISIANTVQGRNYFNRMYSLQKGSVCYFFTFASITSSPAAKGYTGTVAQQVGTQNKTLVDTADTQFKDMVKSFAFVVGPAGQDETKVSPKK